MDDSGARVTGGRGLTFLTRQRCPICEEALALVRRHAGVPVEVVDIDLDLDLLERYNDLVPVVIDSTGRVLATGRLSARQAKRLGRRVRR